MSIRNRWIDSAETDCFRFLNSFGRLSSLEREPKGREWWGENMFTIIKCRFHSSYGLRCERTYYIRIAFRLDFFPFFVSHRLVVFFIIVREESHHSIDDHLRKNEKEERDNNWNYRDFFPLIIYFFFSLFLRRWFYNLCSGALWKTKRRRKEKYIDCSFFLLLIQSFKSFT